MAELSRGGAASVAGQGLANIGALLYERMRQREQDTESRRRYEDELAHRDRSFGLQQEQLGLAQQAAARAAEAADFQQGPAFDAQLASAGFMPAVGGGTPEAASAAGLYTIGDRQYAKPPQVEDVNWSQVTAADGLYERHPRTGEVRPLRDPSTGRQLQPQPNEPPNMQRFFAEGGLYGWTPGAPQAQPVLGPDGRQLQPEAAPRGNSAAIQRAIVSNKSRLNVIDEAIAGVQGRPQSVGITKFSELLNQYLDPDGTPVRAPVADIGSLIIHERSGAAVTASEYPRLKPFIPNIKDRPEVILYKLNRMKTIIDEETRLLEGNASDTGIDSGSPRRSFGGGFDLSAVEMPAPGLQPISQEQYEYLREVQGMADSEIRSRYVVR